MLVFIQRQDRRLPLDTPTQRPWAASGGIGIRFLRNRMPYIGGTGTPYTLFYCCNDLIPHADGFCAGGFLIIAAILVVLLPRAHDAA